MDSKHLAAAQKDLDRMLMILWTAGYVELEPPPPRKQDDADAGQANGAPGGVLPDDATAQPLPEYHPVFAHPTPALDNLQLLRGINPLYGIFLINQLDIADRNERIQAMESVLELPGSVLRNVRVPPPDQLPPGPLAMNRLDGQLLQLGLASAEELGAGQEEDETDRRGQLFQEERVFVLRLAEKLRRLFDYEFPGVHDVRTQAAWAAGEMLEYGGDFNKYITSKGLQKQEGVIFRHLLRLILLTYEFTQFCPPETDQQEWVD
jgi:hypothetical protein